MASSILEAVLKIRPDLAGLRKDLVTGSESVGAEAGAVAGEAFAGAYQDKAGRWHGADGSFISEAQATGAKAGAAFGDSYAASAAPGVEKATAVSRESAIAGVQKTSGAIKNLAGLAAGVVVYDSIKGAMAAQQMGQTVESVFGKNAEQVKKFSESAANSYGVSGTDAEQQIAKTGEVFKTIVGQNAAEAAKSAEKLFGLSSDLAAKFGGNQESMIGALNKAIATGQSRQLKQYGVDISQAAVLQEALRTGVVKTNVDMSKANLIWQEHTALEDQLTKAKAKGAAGSHQVALIQAQLAVKEQAYNTELQGRVPALTAAQRGQATLALVTRQTADSQGYFAGHSKNAAEQLKILQANTTNFKEALGTSLLPVLTQIMKPMSSMLHLFTELPGPVKDGIVYVTMAGAAFSKMGKIVEGVKSLMSGIASIFSAVTGKIQALTGATTANTTETEANAAATKGNSAAKVTNSVASEADAAAETTLAASESAAAAAGTANAEAQIAAGAGEGIAAAGAGVEAGAVDALIPSLMTADILSGGALAVAGAIAVAAALGGGFLLGQAMSSPAAPARPHHDVPQLAAGGTVHPDGRIVHLAEGGKPEDVVPHDKRQAYAQSVLGGGVNYVLNIEAHGMDPKTLAHEVRKQLEKMNIDAKHRRSQTVRVTA